ncbi:hypothetical protein CcaverHIS002_0505180 [Cutaneotrichosporon cavernicola]|uniref:Ribonuclease P/MRP protein subunit POP5 n=1 Tax=Cutaneotrichosporon cavernicola TaxID=279322 RepID=A0AA48QX63_9TREE|nr:uncharacterized protein CcaverHIS019_0505700 [Cutaneotrichosporon cavernicola]BEI85117.1 hypothetical protein CcaverHIS002_0505180 [Cutaneotrichosporon cavernicola]BEI92942.1 hypothetical protein CcaverHIS019_0505700 [Cutaneotrichosporon cavernicola]BEJ00718.1 hypothetical protein CcaverHIS631_0505750 [Cutaneotrichosporon cavernicola]BEJ08485.1 hypothetical protein CcaverHIS641_0505790 [Cutaneotrichosporon cavernicola]
MVRFKYRHLLVEFLDPDSLSPLPSVNLPSPEEVEGEEWEGEEELARIPSLPFVLPLNPTKPLLGDEGASAIYKAVRAMCQNVFGDEGWGRVSSSFKVTYHSSLTTLTLLRVARPHYRLLWAAITLLTTVGGVAVLPRVLAVSGTIKKLQAAAIVHHRRVTAAAVAALLKEGSKGEADKEALEKRWVVERDELVRMEAPE